MHASSIDDHKSNQTNTNKGKWKKKRKKYVFFLLVPNEKSQLNL